MSPAEWAVAHGGRVSPSVPGHLSFLVLCSSEDFFFFFFEPLCSTEHYFMSQMNPRMPCFAEAAETGPPVTGGASLGSPAPAPGPLLAPHVFIRGPSQGAPVSMSFGHGPDGLWAPLCAAWRSSPCEAPRGGWGRAGQPLGPHSPLAVCSSLHLLPPPSPLPFQPGGRGSFHTAPGHFLTLLGPGPLRFLQIRVLIWAAETIRGSQPRSAPAARGVCEGPSEPPRWGAGVYTETFQGRLGLGSQTVLLGSLGLPRGHTFKRSESSVS